MRNLLYLLIFFFILACSNRASNHSSALQIVKSISVFGDTLEVDAEEMMFYDNHILLTTSDDKKVIKVDTTFNVIKTFGNKGRGPGEFTGIGSFNIWQDSLYVADLGSMSFHVFSSDGRYHHSIPFYENYFPRTKFVMTEKGHFYYISQLPGNPITHLTLSGELINQFPTSQNASEKSFAYYNNNGQLLKYKHSLLLVYHSKPLIKQYSLTGELLNTYSLKNLDVLQHRINQIKEERKEIKARKVTFSLFDDAHIFKNKLYLLLYEKTGSKILSFSINNGIKLKEIFSVDGEKLRIFNFFTPSKNGFYAYDVVYDQLLYLKGNKS